MYSLHRSVLLYLANVTLLNRNGTRNGDFGFLIFVNLRWPTSRDTCYFITNI